MVRAERPSRQPHQDTRNAENWSSTHHLAQVCELPSTRTTRKQWLTSERVGTPSRARTRRPLLFSSQSSNPDTALFLLFTLPRPLPPPNTENGTYQARPRKSKAFEPGKKTVIHRIPAQLETTACIQWLHSAQKTSFFLDHLFKRRIVALQSSRGEPLGFGERRPAM